MSTETAYDRDLIARMLGDLRLGRADRWSVAAIEGQIEALRMADNADAAGVHTAALVPAEAKGDWFGDVLASMGETVPLDTPQPAGGEAVYLVATGDACNRLPTYTRHTECPPNCDAERLYTTPPAAPERAHRPSAEWYRHRITECLDVEEPMAGPPAAQVQQEMAYPARATGRGAHHDYIKGWNDCRTTMIAAHPSACELGAVQIDAEQAADAARYRWIKRRHKATVSIKSHWGEPGFSCETPDLDIAIDRAIQHRGDSQEVGRG